MFFYYLTLFLLPFYEHPIASYSVAGITPVKLFGGLAFAWAIVAQFAWNRSPPKSTARICFFLFCLYVGLSIAWNASMPSQRAYMRSISILMFYFTTLTLVDSWQKVVIACVIVMLGMNIAAAYMIRQFLQYGAMYPGYRPSGIFGDPNYYAASAVAIIPVAYCLGRETVNKTLSNFCWITVAASVVGLIVAQSRGGWVGLAVLLLFLFVKSQSKARFVAAAGICFLLLLQFSPIDVTGRFRGSDTGTKASTRARIALLHAGWKMVRENPLLGVGIGNFKPLSQQYEPTVIKKRLAHNTYLELAAENGVPALCLFLLICWYVLRELNQAIFVHRHDSLARAVVTGMSTGIVGFLAAAAFLSVEYEKLFWLLCFLSIAATNLTPITAIHVSDEPDPPLAVPRVASIC